MLGPWYFSTSEWHRRGQENMGRRTSQLNLWSWKQPREACLQSRASSFSRTPDRGGAQAAVVIRTFVLWRTAHPYQVNRSANRSVS